MIIKIHMTEKGKEGGGRGNRDREKEYFISNFVILMTIENLMIFYTYISI